MRALAILLVLLLAGCATPAPTATIAPTPSHAAAVSFGVPTFLAPVTLGAAGRGAEPNLAVAPDGAIYVTGFVQLWRSLDGGASFEAVGKDACRVNAPVCPPGESRKDAGLDGPGDGDFAVDPAGAIDWAGLVGADASLPFQISRDHGDTWTKPVDLANGNSTDREWIDSTANGTLYLTWRDFGSPKDSNPPANLLFRASTDRGAHWGPMRIIAPDALQGPLAHDPRDGAVYTPFYDHGIRIARSADLGVTWTIANVTHEDRDFSLRNGNPIDIFPVPAVDDAGNVYVVWSEDDAAMAPSGAKTASVPRIYLSASHDEGRTWSAPKAISSEGRAAVLPWIVAGADGRIAAAWYENAHGAPNEDVPDQWNVMLVESGDGGATIVGGPATPAPIHLGSICTNGGGCRQECAAITCVPIGECFGDVGCVAQDRSRSDFFEMAITPKGQPILVWTADGDRTAENTGVEIQFGGVASGTPLR